jgi:succinate-semialdehyde dehydrogenase/glutarate-semialdehyde dehydrogenase
MDYGWANTDNLDGLAGELALGHDREERTVETPTTGDDLGEVPMARPEDVELAVEWACEAQRRWADRPVEERAEVLWRLSELALDHRDELLDVVWAETGKERRAGLEEVLDIANTARYYAANAGEFLRSERRTGAVPLLTRTVEHREPAGVVGLITPWNYPLTLTVSDALPALVAGNAVVLKPDPSTPYSALYGARLLREAGLPEDLFQVVPGDGERLGDPLIANVDAVGFTGSTAVGRSVAERAGRHLVDVSLELGGKNPLVVLDDADPDEAAAGAVRASFANAGQLCISTERIYVDRSVYDDFLDRLVAHTRDLTVGVERSWSVEVGTLQSAAQLDRVEAHVEDAREAGATVECGGRPLDAGPYTYAPTVLTDVPPEATLYDEETFGPVVAVYPVEDTDEAVSRANDSPYGLNASVWTGDPERGRTVARRIDCGTVCVNDGYITAWASLDAPMGGMDDSGIGRRHGRQGIEKYTEPKTVADHRGPPLLDSGPLPAGLYARLATAAVRGYGRLTRLLPR